MRIKNRELNKFVIYQYEQDLKKGLEIIRDYFRPVETTARYLYGKHVVRTYKVGEPNIYGTDYDDIENWYISLPIGEGTHIPTLLDVFNHLVREYEYNKIKEIGDDFQNITLHHLTYWIFLEGEDGHIIKNGMVTIVRYAKVLRNKSDTLSN